MLTALAVFFAGGLFAAPPASYAADFSQVPVTTGVSVIMIDADTGETLYEKNADEVRAPASLTKVMTALVAFDSGMSMGTLVTVDQETQDVGEVQIQLAAGEEISLGDLMAATLIYSANDAAMGIAKAVAPTSEEFEAMMNAKAAKLGMVNTHFNNPNGLQAAEHYSTARDMAVLTRAALDYDEFVEYAQMPSYIIPATNMHEERSFVARNLLVRDSGATIMVYGERRPVYYEGAIGVKTGFTNEAGNCLIGAAKRGDMTVITVVLGSPPPGHQYEDTVSLFEYAFYNFTKLEIFGAEDVARDLGVNGGREEKVAVTPTESFTKILTNAQAETLEYEYELPESVDAPIEKGAVLGSVKAVAGGETIAETTLVSASEVLLPPTIFERLSFGNKKVEKVLKIAAIVLLAFILLIVLLLVRKSIILRKRRKRNGASSGRRAKRKARLYEVKDLGKVNRKG
jgi:D-alanyl-D-alanine carboxypeptidase (penicillin-binding protein 5/6)